MSTGTMLLAIMSLGIGGEDSQGAAEGLADHFSVRAVEYCRNSQRGFLLSGSGMGTMLEGEAKRAFRLTPAEASDSIARIVQAGVLNFSESVKNETYVSVEDGGLRKITVISVESCRFEIEIYLEDVRKKVVFEDVGVVPNWLREDFHKLLRRAEES